jgi:hypothetical protein
MKSTNIINSCLKEGNLSTQATKCAYTLIIRRTVIKYNTKAYLLVQFI